MVEETQLGILGVGILFKLFVNGYHGGVGSISFLVFFLFDGPSFFNIISMTNF
jgi:hypothetical protein